MTTNDELRLEIGIGAIEPTPRIASGEISSERLGEFCAQLKSGDFFSETSEIIPRKCVDGRPRLNGASELAPNSSGGTFTLVVSDALTAGRFRASNENASDQASSVYKFLAASNYKIGGHDAEHVSNDGCGCGAEDKLVDILEFIANQSNDIRQLAATLGVSVSDETNQLISSRTNELVSSGYTSSGASLRQAMIDANGDVETLTGDHKEVALIINTQTGVTLDRPRLSAEFGDNYQAFNVDVAPLKQACEIISLSAEAAEQNFAAAIYYNIAVAAVLAGPSLRLIVH